MSKMATQLHARRNQASAMRVLSMEIHVSTRGGLLPDPKHDAVCAVFWATVPLEDVGDDEDGAAGFIACASDRVRRVLTKLYPGRTKAFVSSELELLQELTAVVRELDPDILAGFETHNASWGYVVERAQALFEYDICDDLSRLVDGGGRRKFKDTWNAQQTSSLKVPGRHIFNVWRLLRSEVNLLQYSFENCVFELLEERVPSYSHRELSAWYAVKAAGPLKRVFDHHMARCSLNLRLLAHQETVERTSEQARLLGVDFFSVLSRGSQFKVESLMFRLAKPENFVLVSPSRHQVGQQNALECLPLVMEPASDFYTSPVVVLDFQSLYPSIMIAYNYCYSTCLGRVAPWKGINKLGFVNLETAGGLVSMLRDDVNISPNGLAFVKSSTRRSLLAKMLKEILETRVMVKSGMKDYGRDGNMHRLLNNRQLALKLIANVTYGYTSASFSGRMPCAEVADAIVQTGREILETAVGRINGHPRWRARVVYGDTDSLFVHLPGRPRAEAFDIGQEIVDEITGLLPKPVRLKMEKVYLPSILLSKKRYVGFMYESRDQAEPAFDAKGIETVRRDGTPAEQKIEEKALKILFRTADLSQVKAYFQEQCDKIMRNKVSVQDFCFAKEVRLGTYRDDKGLLPPGALLSVKNMQQDPRAEPQYRERVPYVVVAGPPGSRLVDRCMFPEDFLAQPNRMLDANYYITKNIIPPLERIFNLVGADVRAWYEEMPKTFRLPFRSIELLETAKRHTIHSFMRSAMCLVCRQREARAPGALCDECVSHADTSIYAVETRAREAHRRVRQLTALCRTCTGISHVEEIACTSRDCPVYFSRVHADARLRERTSIAAEVTGQLESVL
ncbi:DNA polymerase [Dipodascopsis tothii]|uniref:DNA polymerase n=1 Tax=Dipodascopsis tothii TaxID=44089 RepID=UPI0034CE3C17